eukprot:12423575-Karenia_brevis.AAC.1
MMTMTMMIIITIIITNMQLANCTEPYLSGGWGLRSTLAYFGSLKRPPIDRSHEFTSSNQSSASEH